MAWYAISNPSSNLLLLISLLKGLTGCYCLIKYILFLVYCKIKCGRGQGIIVWLSGHGPVYCYYWPVNQMPSDFYIPPDSVSPISLLWTIQQLFRNWWMFNFVFSSCLKRFSLNVTFYSLYLGMGNFGFSIFLIQLMYGAIEIPAILLNMWLLEVFGRRILFIFTALSGGLCSVLTLAVSQGKPLGWVRIVWIHVFCPVGQV